MRNQWFRSSGGPRAAVTLKMTQVRTMKGMKAIGMKPVQKSRKSKLIMLKTQLTAQKAKNIFASMWYDPRKAKVQPVEHRLVKMGQTVLQKRRAMI